MIIRLNFNGEFDVCILNIHIFRISHKKILFTHSKKTLKLIVGQVRIKINSSLYS